MELSTSVPELDSSGFITRFKAKGGTVACTFALCSLRDAIIAANANAGADVITLPAGIYNLSIAGQNEDAAATSALFDTTATTRAIEHAYVEMGQQYRNITRAAIDL